jgi:hypothetical protein
MKNLPEPSKILQRFTDHNAQENEWHQRPMSGCPPTPRTPQRLPPAIAMMPTLSHNSSSVLTNTKECFLQCNIDTDITDADSTHTATINAATSLCLPTEQHTISGLPWTTSPLPYIHESLVPIYWNVIYELKNFFGT